MNDRHPFSKKSDSKKSDSKGDLGLTAEDLLHAFDHLRQNRSAKRPSPHKPLMVLLALGRILRGDRRFMAYSDIQGPGTSLIEDYGLNARQPDPCLPFTHLSGDRAGQGRLWEIRDWDEIQRRLKEDPATREKIEHQSPLMLIRSPSRLKKHDVEAGFTAPVYHLLKGNHRLIFQIARRLLDKEFPETLHADILARVGLDEALDEMDHREAIVKRRPRDPRFREEVLVAYGYRCAVCDYNIRLGNTSLGVEAAHIRWHAYRGPDRIDNGLALCTIHHRALDNGAIGIDEGMRVMVSDHVNGDRDSCERYFHRFRGKEIHLPYNADDRPDPDHLEWHLDRVFRSRRRRPLASEPLP
ncbi:phosphorothioated DNA-binding restriction endonuclease [Thioalkalivibrio sp. HK1]|uniref:phosphorothioated DNA-binding restriction endonuclease n=1 Tax=Thioalkalivibrio sp. HK1 TaxID=1469245 RepID=UPI0018CC2DEB|nr:HNH endonuclease [Thioalkalivibrio sp. HK1]